MFVRLKYYEFGRERGYTMYVNTKKEIYAKLERLGASIKDVFKLEILKEGDEDFKEYDPEILQ